jgi:hypothetical protein
VEALQKLAIKEKFRLDNLHQTEKNMNSKQTLEHLSQYFCHPLHVAAALNKLSISDFKRIYQAHGIHRWPYNKYRNKTPSSLSGFQDFQLNTPTPVVKQKKTILKQTPIAQKPEESKFNLEFEMFCNNLENSGNNDLIYNYLVEEEALFLPVNL